MKCTQTTVDNMLPIKAIMFSILSILSGERQRWGLFCASVCRTVCTVLEERCERCVKEQVHVII